MRGGSRAAANLGENEDAGGVARGAGEEGAAGGQGWGLQGGQDLGGVPPAWPWPKLGALSPGHRAPPLLSGLGSACGHPGTNSPCPHQPSLLMLSPFFLLAQLQEQLLAVPAPQVVIAAPRGTWDICTGKSHLVQVLPDLPPVPTHRSPSQVCCTLPPAAASSPGTPQQLCGRLRFIHYFISTRL